MDRTINNIGMEDDQLIDSHKDTKIKKEDEIDEKSSVIVPKFDFIESMEINE